MFRGAVLLINKIISKRIEEYYEIANLITRTRKPIKD